MKSTQLRKETEIMRKTLFLPLLLLCMTAALLFAGCGDPTEVPSEEGIAAGNTAGTVAGTVAGTAAETEEDRNFTDAEGNPLTPEDQAWAEIAAEALWNERSYLPARKHFSVSVIAHSDGTYAVRFTLRIGEYRTGESYNISLSRDGQVTEINGSNTNFRKFLKNATPEKIAAAEASLAEQMGHLADQENSAYYLNIDDQGYLCLSCEVIVQLSGGADGDGGCGIDHEHKFFTERICLAE